MTDQENKEDLHRIGEGKMSSSFKERLKRTARKTVHPLLRPEVNVSESSENFSQKCSYSSLTGSSASTPETSKINISGESSYPLPRSSDSMPESDDQNRSARWMSTVIKSEDSPSESDSDISLDMEVTEEPFDPQPHSQSEENVSYSLEDIRSCNDREQLKKMRLQILREFDKNKDALRKLKLFEYYETNSDFQNMTSSVKSWLTAAQVSLRELYNQMPGPKIKFAAFLQFLQMDFDLINYDPETDAFLEGDEM